MLNIRSHSVSRSCGGGEYRVRHQSKRYAAVSNQAALIPAIQADLLPTGGKNSRLSAERGMRTHRLHAVPCLPACVNCEPRGPRSLLHRRDQVHSGRYIAPLDVGGIGFSSQLSCIGPRLWPAAHVGGISWRGRRPPPANLKRKRLLSRHQ